MRHFRWVQLAFLLVVAASCISASTKGEVEEAEGEIENPWIRRDTYLALPAEESQQVSLVAATDLQTSASGYGKGSKHHKGVKGYKSGHHDKKSYKGHKGYKDDKGYKKKHKGDYGKAHKKGYHDKGGKYYKGHEDKHKYYGDDHKGKKGKKGHHYGSKGHHNKGHKDKGFKNVYHKEEYHTHKKYYDDHDSQKYHHKYDELDSYFKANKGKDYKGGEYKDERSPILNSLAKADMLTTEFKATLNDKNEIYPNGRHDEDIVETLDPITSPTPDGTQTMTFQGRTLLSKEMSRGSIRQKDKKRSHREQCQVSDLRMIRRYLRYCLKHTGELGVPKEGAPPCTEEDLEKIKKYLTFCQNPFLAKASRQDKKQYRQLVTIAKKLHKRNNIIEEEEVFENVQYGSDVCDVNDLRQLKNYLQNCYHGKENAEYGLPECDLQNFQKSLDYLLTCEITYLSSASRRDRRQYGRLILLASDMKAETEQVGRTEQEHAEEEVTCYLEDLREAYSYVKQCAKMKHVEKYKKLYKKEACKPEHLFQIKSYLLECEPNFLMKASRKDIRKYSKLIDISVRLGTDGNDKKIKEKPRSEEKKNAQNKCSHRDLQKIPSYLKDCAQSKSCKLKQLSRVHNFLKDCENDFLPSASRKDKSQYNDLTLKAEMLSTKESIHHWRENTKEEKEHLKNICKRNNLRKIPKYLQQCIKSKNCKKENLLQAKKFLGICEDFFTVASTPKDRERYKKLIRLTKRQIKGVKSHYIEKKEKAKPQKRNTGPNCNIIDLRKIPQYLSSCIKTKDCKQKQLQKVHQFLFVCEITFTSRASGKDKNKYKKLLNVSENLTRKQPIGKKLEIKKDDVSKKCSISVLRKIPSYLNDCQKQKNCKVKQLVKAHLFLEKCKKQFTEKARKPDLKKYNQLERKIKTNIIVLQKQSEVKSKHVQKQSEVQSKHVRQKNKKAISPCQIHDLRKVPEYLSNCLKSNACKKKQLSKVSKFLTTCKDHFTGRASKQDLWKYRKLINVSDRLTSKRQQVRKGKKHEVSKSKKQQVRKCKKQEVSKSKKQRSSEGKTHQDSKKGCHTNRLRKLYRYVQSLEKTTKHASKSDGSKKHLKQIVEYLINCKSTFTGKASKKDKVKYTKLIHLSKKLGNKRPEKVENPKRKPKVAAKSPSCKVKNLRKVQIYLTKCGNKKTRQEIKRNSCEKDKLRKVKTYLTTCKKEFLQKASRSEKRQYENLIRSTKLSKEKKKLKPKVRKNDKKSLSRKSEKHKQVTKSKKQKQVTKPKKQKPVTKSMKQNQVTKSKKQRCKVQQLRQVYKFMEKCRNVKYIERNKDRICEERKIVKVNNYLTTCRDSFFKIGSKRDKRIYEQLRQLATKSSKAIKQKQVTKSKKQKQITKSKKQKQVTRSTKRGKTFSCNTEDITKLQTHMRYCKNKMKRERYSKSQSQRSTNYKRRREQKAKKIREKRQLRKHTSHSLKKCRGKRCIENGHRQSRERRARHKNRKGGKHHDKHGKKGHYEKGKYHDDHKGKKGHYEHKGHYGDKSSYSKKGGHKGDYGHEDHKGHGHDDHHGHGYGHDDHHGHGHSHGGYGHSDHGGYGSHSNVKPIATPVQTYSAPGPAPIYVPAPAASYDKSSTASGFHPSPKLVVPPPYIASPSATSSQHSAVTSGTQPVGSPQTVFTPITFESFGDFGKF